MSLKCVCVCVGKETEAMKQRLTTITSDQIPKHNLFKGSLHSTTWSDKVNVLNVSMHDGLHKKNVER